MFICFGSQGSSLRKFKGSLRKNNFLGLRIGGKGVRHTDVCRRRGVHAVAVTVAVKGACRWGAPCVQRGAQGRAGARRGAQVVAHGVAQGVVQGVVQGAAQGCTGVVHKGLQGCAGGGAQACTGGVYRGVQEGLPWPSSP